MQFNGRVTEGSKYENLNQSKVYQPILQEGNRRIGVYYLKSPKVLKGKDFKTRTDMIMGMDKYTIPALKEIISKKFDLYSQLGRINLPDHICIAEYLFKSLHGESWSPYGEATDMVEKLSTHTSMSIGDIIKIDTKRYLVDTYGFKEIILTHDIRIMELQSVDCNNCDHGE